MEITSCLIQNELFTFKLHKTPRIFNTKSLILKVGIVISSSTTLVKTWHNHLGHLSYSNLKQLGNSRSINMSKLKSEEDLPLSQICTHTKQRQNPSYKPQFLADDICEELNIDLIGSITAAGWNGCRYALTITNYPLICCWVEDLHKKREARSVLRKFVIFIKI